ncbi:21579_t:CDS:2, partial [Gigaspora margarita]
MNRYHLLFAVIFFVLFSKQVSSQQCACRYNSDCENVCTFPVWNWCLNDECVKPCSQNNDCALKICNNSTCGCHSNSDCPAAFPFCYPVDGRDYEDCRICKDDNDCVKTGVLGFNICVNAIVSNVVLMINAMMDKFVENNSNCSVWFSNCVNINDTIPGVKRCWGCAEIECPDSFCQHNLCCKQKGCTCKARFDCPEDSYCSAAGNCEKCPLPASS